MGGTHSKLLCQLRSTCLVEMVHSEELVSDSRTSSVSAECTDRPRIQEPEGSMRLDDQPSTVSPDSRSARLLSGRSVCFSPDSAATRYFSWRIDPEAEAVEAFKQDWSHYRGFAC